MEIEIDELSAMLMDRLAEAVSFFDYIEITKETDDDLPTLFRVHAVEEAGLYSRGFHGLLRISPNAVEDGGEFYLDQMARKFGRLFEKNRPQFPFHFITEQEWLTWNWVFVESREDCMIFERRGPNMHGGLAWAPNGNRTHFERWNYHTPYVPCVCHKERELQ